MTHERNSSSCFPRTMEYGLEVVWCDVCACVLVCVRKCSKANHLQQNISLALDQLRLLPPQEFTPNFSSRVVFLCIKNPPSSDVLRTNVQQLSHRCCSAKHFGLVKYTVALQHCSPTTIKSPFTVWESSRKSCSANPIQISWVDYKKWWCV